MPDPSLLSLLPNIKSHGLVPDVISQVPRNAVVVTYHDGDVRMGNTLRPSQAAHEPTSVIFRAEAGSFYTLVMVDPDAPSRQNPKMRHWLHWLVVNIPSSCDLRAGTPVTEYAGPTPPRGSGPHRYVFLVFAQGRRRINEDSVDVPEGRGKFNLREFLVNLELGQAYAANFFLAENK
ncbi:protein D3-like [Ornithodoros turicata]|uniref:protein D3-like n=1 Tax=Ornithodoros turicata TaxID=34597 RepID=UPI0031390376